MTKVKVSVPESVLRRQRREERLMKEKEQALTKKRVRSKTTRQIITRRAEFYVKEYRTKERDMIRLAREAKKNGNVYVKPENPLAFIVRIKGIMKIPPKPRKILQLFRLTKINSGTFVRLTEATLRMIQWISPYVAWGYPNLKSVRELIYKRGFLKINGERIPITSNCIIQEHLQEYGIICVEDVIHEIFTVGPAFKQVNSFLWPFNLNSPSGGFRGKKSQNFIEGGSNGNRETRINALIHQMI